MPDLLCNKAGNTATQVASGLAGAGACGNRPDVKEIHTFINILHAKGWRVQYNYNAVAYTNAPSTFDEFFNQRRRWSPSTYANLLDLLSNSSATSKKNENISWVYMLYQGTILFGKYKR